MSKLVPNKHRAFSLIELLAVIAVMGILASVLVAAVGSVRQQSNIAKSTSNIRQLATANFACVAETGHYAKAANLADDIRWHGSKVGGKWQGTGGYLTPYLGEDREIRNCPVFEQLLDTDAGAQFDEGTGGYGYNAFYLGENPRLNSTAATGTPALGATRGGATVAAEPKPNAPIAVKNPGRTVMFTSAALVRGNGVVETYLSAPYKELAGGNLGQSLTPTTHFRFNDRALVAWCDGHVTLEEPNDASTSHNVYGDDNDAYKVGWFGPTDNNGYWNPNYASGLPY